MHNQILILYNTVMIKLQYLSSILKYFSFLGPEYAFFIPQTVRMYFYKTLYGPYEFGGKQKVDE